MPPNSILIHKNIIFVLIKILVDLKIEIIISFTSFLKAKHKSEMEI